MRGLMGMVAAVAVLVATGQAAAQENPAGGGAAAADEAQARRIEEHLATLRDSTFGHDGPWPEAVRGLAEIGEPAVPALVEELDRTTDPWPMRMLGFTLRAIGDPRAVPALIRAIPRATGRIGGEQQGLKTGDAATTEFMRKHDLESTNRGSGFRLAVTYREVTATLTMLTKQDFDANELNFVDSDLGGPDQRRQQDWLLGRLVGGERASVHERPRLRESGVAGDREPAAV